MRTIPFLTLKKTYTLKKTFIFIDIGDVLRYGYGDYACGATGSIIKLPAVPFLLF